MSNGIHDLLRQLRADVRDMIRDAFGAAIGYTSFTLSSSSGDKDAVAGRLTEESDFAADPTVKARDFDSSTKRMQHYGFRSRPPKDVSAVKLAVGGSPANCVTVAEDSSRYGPSDLDDGEVAAYGLKDGQKILFKKDGTLEISGAAGETISSDIDGNWTIAPKDGTGTVTVTATAVTGAVKLGPVGTLPVLVEGTFDSLGVPVTQAPAATLTIVKAG